jgi:hypothetical protein
MVSDEYFLFYFIFWGERKESCTLSMNEYKVETFKLSILIVEYTCKSAIRSGSLGYVGSLKRFTLLHLQRFIDCST